jgi:hypothetical protein
VKLFIILQLFGWIRQIGFFGSDILDFHSFSPDEGRVPVVETLNSVVNTTLYS